MLKVLKELGYIKDTNRKWLRVQCSECLIEWDKTTGDYNKNPNGFCLKCARKKAGKKALEKSKASFINRANEAHNFLYDYTLATYKSATIPLDIICKEHGVFSMRPNNHCSAPFQGCPKCGKEAMAIKHSDKARITFTDRAVNVHGVKYDYSQVDYINSKSKVKIKCSSHSYFWQRPSDHLKGHGCPKCTTLSDYDALYIWRVNNTNTFKIGVTSARLNVKRVYEVAKALTKSCSFETVPTIELLVHASNALEIEKVLHTKFTTIDQDIPRDFAGYSEFRVLTNTELTEAVQIVHELTK